MDVQQLITSALWTKNAVHELKDDLTKAGSRGEMITLENAIKALAELLDRYRTGKWEGPIDGNGAKPGEGESLNNDDAS